MLIVIVGVYGFLSDSRRTNVAVTRARRHLALIGDSSVLAREPFLKELIDYCHLHGEVWSAQQYINGTYSLLNTYNVSRIPVQGVLYCGMLASLSLFQYYLLKITSRTMKSPFLYQFAVCFDPGNFRSPCRHTHGSFSTLMKRPIITCMCKSQLN